MDICRCCLYKPKCPKTVRKFTNDVQYEHNLIKMLEFVLGRKDGIENCPSYICNTCETNLIVAYHFKKLCIKNEEKFVEILANFHHLEPKNFIKEDRSLEKINVKEIHFEITDGSSIRNKCKSLIRKPKTSSSTEQTISDKKASLEHEQSRTISEVTKECIREKPGELEFKIKFSCLKCNVTFQSSNEYQIHYRQLHRKKELCSQCGVWVAPHRLDNHELCHSNPKQHICNECGKSFTLIDNLRQHVRIHKGEHRYECQHCGKKFIHWNSRRLHIRIHHTMERNYECMVCGKKFYQSSNLIRHMRCHTGEMPHQCKYCVKKFSSTAELRNHTVTHTKEKNEICEVCSKSFGTRKSLKVHLRTHTGERRYVCPLCSKAFTQSHVLRTHLKTHPGDSNLPSDGIVSESDTMNKLEE